MYEGQLEGARLLNELGSYCSLARGELVTKARVGAKDKRLAKFDRADRKWIALSRASARRLNIYPPITQATDLNLKCKQFAATLRAYGVDIDFICS
jgi:hypothetical protein